MLKVIKFSAKWCQPCTALHPSFLKVKETFVNNQEVMFKDVDIDSDTEMRNKYSISSIPCVIIEKDGIIVNKIVGIQPINSYVNMIKNSL